MSDHPSATNRPPPRGPRLRRLAAIAALALLAVVIGVAVGPTVQDQLRSWRGSDQDPAITDDTGTWYISQMHPWIIQPEPGQCPICGMDLTPVDPDRFAGELTIDPQVVQNIGVRISEARQGDLTSSLRTVGSVTVDEERVTDVVVRFTGWVEEIHVASRWTRVAAGDPLATITAPTVYAAEEEFLLARSRDDDTGRELAIAARERLELLGVPAAELQRLEREGTAARQITLRSPVDGVVWMLGVNRGSEIGGRTVAYRIADLSQLWVEATIYPHQLPAVRVGMPAVVEVADGRASARQASVVELYPAVDEKTRASRARIVVDNADGHLRPGMYATVRLPTTVAEDAVLVPREAVIGTGDRRIAFVSRGRGTFEPREVVLGPSGDDGMVAVREGLAAGEPVVVSGQFLLDSESRMREALVKIMRGDLASQHGPTSAAAATASLPTALDDEWRALLDAYLALQAALYQGDGPIPQLVADLRQAGSAFAAAAAAADEHLLHRLPILQDLLDAIAALSGDDPDSLRPGFGAIGVALVDALKELGQDPERRTPLVAMRCGMAENVPQQGVWVQTGPDVRNPYYGATSGMRSCAAETWAIPSWGATGEAGGPSAEDAEPAADDDPAAAEDPGGDDSAEQDPQPDRSPWTADQWHHYRAIGSALYHGDLAAAHQAAAELAASDPGQPAVATIAEAADLEAARIAFGELGVALRTVVEERGSPIEGLAMHRCGMARGIADKGVWFQAADATIANPYFGAEHGMNECAIGSWRVTTTGLEPIE